SLMMICSTVNAFLGIVPTPLRSLYQIDYLSIWYNDRGQDHDELEIYQRHWLSTNLLRYIIIAQSVNV
ncbi:MAG: hypothetical protein PHT84_04150, partial [Candidatus Pacebacteria bacterium]|nr:hypothetical protein [Candidatus Paceibacterota bacterium]